MVNGNSSTAAATGSKPLWSSDSDISKEPWLYYTTSRNVKNLSQAPPGERLTGYTLAILGNGRGGQNSQSAEGHGINPIRMNHVGTRAGSLAATVALLTVAGLQTTVTILVAS